MALEVRSTLREYASGVNEARRLAQGTVAWLVVLGLERIYELGVTLRLSLQPTHEYEFELLMSEELWAGLAKIATAGVFLWWLANVVRLTNALSPRRLRWGPVASVLWFFVPMMNLFLPCTVLYQVNAALVPSAIPEPLPRAVADPSSGYREIRWSPFPAPPPLPRASILAWWCTYCLGSLLRWSANCGCLGECSLGVWSASLLAPMVDIVSIAFAIVMVRGITGRLVERLRRIEHNDDEVVRAAGVILT
jgi:hypothetical protein